MTTIFGRSLWTRYFLESLPRVIIGSKAQQLSVSADVPYSFRIVHHLLMMISENKENDRKSHKLDDNGGDVDSGICATEPTILSGRQIMKELAHFFGDSVLQTDIHLLLIEALEFNIVTAYISSYCLDSGNWIIYCGMPSSFHGTNTHSSPFNESVFNNADVIILSDLYDKIENMEIRNRVVNA
ncbi:hypothetical protein RhiirA4_466158 [Rhizophagus irregularis]|uniref:Uncharacterized protein n=1 Tax=Rhizophagus irregularis TaxID=588596 RepID=A0A2I1GTI3_9GLOM|nr:hypothetical protein RhiirA4_466158 [Rhizophagus irregularis]